MSGEQREEGMGEGGKKTGQWNLNLSLNNSQPQLDVNAIYLRDFAFECLFGFSLYNLSKDAFTILGFFSE